MRWHAAFRCPHTCLVERVSDLEQRTGRMQYPSVVKSIRSRVPTAGGWTGTAVHYVHTREDLFRLYDDVESLSRYPSMIQQRIVGPGLAIFVLFDRGELLTAFAHRRLREKPPSGGVSVLSESVPVSPRLREFAIRLLGPLGWHGVAMLEFKQDERSGEPFLMEVNGRFWGSLQLAISAGVDFPYLAYQLAVGERPSVPHTYRIGVRNRWLLGDFDHLVIRLTNTARTLNLADSAPSKLRTILDFLKFVDPALHYEIVSADDPAPFLYELAHYVKAAVSATTARVSRTIGRRRAGSRASVSKPSNTVDRSSQFSRLAN